MHILNSCVSSMHSLVMIDPDCQSPLPRTIHPVTMQYFTWKHHLPNSCSDVYYECIDFVDTH